MRSLKQRPLFFFYLISVASWPRGPFHGPKSRKTTAKDRRTMSVCRSGASANTVPLAGQAGGTCSNRGLASRAVPCSRAPTSQDGRTWSPWGTEGGPEGGRENCLRAALVERRAETPSSRVPNRETSGLPIPFQFSRPWPQGVDPITASVGHRGPLSPLPLLQPRSFRAGPDLRWLGDCASRSLARCAEPTPHLVPGCQVPQAPGCCWRPCSSPLTSVAPFPGS